MKTVVRAILEGWDKSAIMMVDGATRREHTDDDHPARLVERDDEQMAPPAMDTVLYSVQCTRGRAAPTRKRPRYQRRRCR